jgi:hypothetical protein
MSTREEYQRTLTRMIDRLTSGECSVKDFRRAYYDFWLEEVPTGVMSPEEEDLSSAIQEKLDWTAEQPSDEERGYGWLDEREYVDWVKLEQIKRSSARGRPL